MVKYLRFILFLVIVGSSCLPIQRVYASARIQESDLLQKAQVLMQAMTPAERVGQVFLVTFTGSKVTEESPIMDLVINKNIGGIILLAENDNFTGPENTVESLQELIKALQTARWEASLSEGVSTTTHNYVPLLFGISQSGDLYPDDQILNGLTVMPSQMAVGATWDPSNAYTIGATLGGELNALGINLLIGPSLDVLDAVRLENPGKAGVDVYGGDPFWVGEMGKSYIKGVHEGSDNKIAVIAKHFPGLGSSDRDPEEEIATIRKSLEQLKQIELAPFFSVTGNAEEPAEIADGLLLAHIRYQGFQGNIRTTTKPLSFDSAALEQILSLAEFSTWREQGGLIISDNLGSEAVRKFFDPLFTGFDARQVARSALLAGNDMLYLGNILSTGETDSYTTVVRIIDYFVQNYQQDSVFQARVDQAALRSLMLKLRLNPEMTLSAALPKVYTEGFFSRDENLITEIAQEAATLISPDYSAIESVLPDPPGYHDRIVFISNVTSFKQCSTCLDQSIFPADSLMQSIIKLYGSGTGGQIQVNRLNAYSYERLKLLLENGSGIEDIQDALFSADWIVFAFSDAENSQLESTIFRRLFNERPDLVRNKIIIGLSFNAPHFLDSTDISKFTAYYGLYSKTPVFYKVAARLLFKELTPTGDLPVSVQGIGYDLISATSPDPNQTITVYIDSGTNTAAEASTPPAGYSQPLLYKAGDTIPIRAGIILDNNGNPVPDETIVKFIIDSRSANGTLEQFEIQSNDGIAQMSYLIPSIGSLEIRATSDPALTSQILRLDITDLGGVVTSFEPTQAIPTSDVVTPTTTPTEVSIAPSIAEHNKGRLSLVDWFLATALVLGTCLLFNWFARKALSMKWNVLTTISMALGGNLAYGYLALGLPGAEQAIQRGGTLLSLFSVVLGMSVGCGVGFLLFWLAQRKKESAQQREQ